MTQGTHLNQSEKLHTKRVWYSGSDQLSIGQAVCYDRDYGTAATREMGRAWQVEKPSAANIMHFAGIVTTVNSRGVAGMIEIIEPIGPTLADVFTNASVVVDATDLFLVPGSYILQTTGGRRIARAMQTVDRSTTNGIALARLFPVAEVQSVSARSRTAVQLPTAAIWNNFPIEEMRVNPFLGSLLETDFTHNIPAFNSFVDATYAASAAGKTPTEHIFPGPLAIGELCLFTTTDNQAAEIQFYCPITLATVLAPATKWAFGCRIKQSVITNDKLGYFAGLMKAQKLTGDLIADAGTLGDFTSIGFQVKEGDGDKVDVIYDLAGQTQNEYDDDWCTQAGDTYNVFELYYNGTTIAMYLDGVATGTAIPNANMDDTDFPTGVLVPTIAMKAAHADDATVTVDWLRCAQLST